MTGTAHSRGGVVHHFCATPPDLGVDTDSPTESDSRGSEVSDATVDLRKELDKKLESLVPEETVSICRQPASELSTKGSSPSSNDPFGFVCAFGFTGPFKQPAAIPTTKAAFLEAIKAEIQVIGWTQKGLQAYQQAINSRQYHTFTTTFLINENTATVITLDQLDQITVHLNKVKEEVQDIEQEDGEVSKELMEAFRHAQPWVARTRAILKHSHVFYKINFVLACNKKTTPA